jgi:predicted ATPase/DNA-binding CsgD family transcriptional regulator/tetratricopeptide (TPR) repeat protein
VVEQCHVEWLADGVIGRDVELWEVTALLTRFRLVTLTGVAGVGKSGLAASIAGGAKENIGVSAVTVDLARVKAGEAASFVAAAVGCPHGDGDPVTAIVRAIDGRELLVVLDNVEHVVNTVAALVFKLLRVVRGVRFLVTSREPLAIAGERCWPVRPLAVPDHGASDVRSVATSPAVALFCRRALAVRQGFRLTAKTASSVSELCRRLDGLPLAIELAAAQTGRLSPREIADGLDGRFQLLAGEGAIHHRHAGLAQALDWSVDRLDGSEARLLRRLSVFSGGWTLDAAEAVCSDVQFPVASVLEGLVRLVTKSLVEADTGGEESRYRLLETIRVYAGSLLVGTERADCAGRHTAWFAALAEQAAEGLFGSDQQPWLDRVTAELGNLRLAQASAIRAGNASLAVQLGALLAEYFWSTGRPTDGLRSLEPVVDMVVGAAPATRARAAGAMSLVTGALCLPGREEALATATELFDQLGNASGRARTMLAVRRIEHAGPPDGLSALEEIEALARAAEDWWCVTQVLTVRSLHLLHRGEPGEARRLAEQAVAISSGHNDKHGLQSSLLALGELELHRGELRAAGSRLDGARRLATERRDGAGAGRATLLLARLAGARGDDHTALALAEEVLDLARDAGIPVLLAAAHTAVGAHLLTLGDSVGARKHFDDADACTEQAEGPPSAPPRWRAMAMAVEGDLRGARRALERGLRSSRAKGDQLEIAASLGALAELALQQGDDAGAKCALHQALVVQNRCKEVRGLLETIERLGEIAVLGGAVEQGARLLTAAQAQRGALGMPLPRARRQPVEEVLELVGQSLTPERVAATVAEGAALTLEEAVAYATKGRGVRGRPALGPTSLTATEYAIARLVAEGLTNTEIAQRMLVSPGTVKSHLGHVFAKLGVTSRVKLAREMAEGKR